MTGSNSKDGVIHVIDDDRDIVTIATTILKNNGYQVHSFTEPSEALDDIRTKCKQKVSLVITDIRMPVHNGFEVARRAREIVPDVPIVLMTAFEINPFEFDRVFPSLTGVDFLQKPFRANKLLKIAGKYQSKDSIA